MIQSRKKWNISEDFICMELKPCTVVTVVTRFHNMPIVTFPWQHNEFQTLFIQKGKSEFSSFEKYYLLVLFIQWVWANMEVTQQRYRKVR